MAKVISLMPQMRLLNLNSLKRLGQKGLNRLFRIELIRQWMRLGHAAKGLLYGLIGMFAVRGVVFDDREVGGSDMVLRALGERSVGSMMLALLSIGLVGYSLWRLVQMAIDPPHSQKLTVKRVLQRCGYAVSGLTYLGVGYAAGRLAIGLTVDFDDTVEDLASVLFDFTIGPLALSAIGLGVILVGLTYIYGAFSGDFLSYFQARLDESIRQSTMWMGKIGFTARGGSFVLIGAYLMKAAYLTQDDHAGGLGNVLDQLDDQAGGEIWLSAIAFGFIAYASYMLMAAFYRKFPSSPPIR